jgi:hypothetical protein
MSRPPVLDRKRREIARRYAQLHYALHCTAETADGVAYYRAKLADLRTVRRSLIALEHDTPRDLFGQMVAHRNHPQG